MAYVRWFARATVGAGTQGRRRPKSHAIGQHPVVAVAGTLALLSGCSAERAGQPVATLRHVATATPRASAYGYAVSPAQLTEDVPAISAAAMPDHVGQHVSIKGHVRWCQAVAGTYIYALDSEGTARFIVAATDAARFNPVALSAFCSATSVRGTVKKQGANYLIQVQSPEQVTL